MSRNGSTPTTTGTKTPDGTGTSAVVPKDAGYLAHMATQLASQLEVLHTFAMQNEAACKSVMVGAIGAAWDSAANLRRELDVLEAAQ